MSSIYLNGGRYGGGVKTLQYSETKPTEVSEVGKIVLNSLPNPNEYIGWVYTPLGWLVLARLIA